MKTSLHTQSKIERRTESRKQGKIPRTTFVRPIKCDFIGFQLKTVGHTLDDLKMRQKENTMESGIMKHKKKGREAQKLDRTRLGTFASI